MDQKSGSSGDGDASVYKTLLESTKAIPWKIDWSNQQFSYIGPQIEQLLGWSQSSWVSANDWAARIHEEDRQRVVNFCISQSQAGVDHEADYRALTRTGDYVWIRDVVHVVRNAAGEVLALVGFMFDISERKKNEEELSRLNKQLEDFSFKDELTGLANRRMFNLTLEEEWTRALRNQSPLSLIMLDIDYFKQYNDHYGHLQGDDCLQKVGLTLGAMSARAADLIARFGGEEFAILLPDSDKAAALGMAERCRSFICDLHLPHEMSPLDHVLTISVGVETMVPSRADTPRHLVDAVDKLLYQGSKKGATGWNRAWKAPRRLPARGRCHCAGPRGVGLRQLGHAQGVWFARRRALGQRLARFLKQTGSAHFKARGAAVQAHLAYQIGKTNDGLAQMVHVVGVHFTLPPVRLRRHIYPRTVVKS